MSPKARIDLLILDDRGAILITVTWIVLIISLLATSALVFALIERRTLTAVEREYQSQLLADSAVEIFMHRLFYDEEKQVFRSGALEVQGHSIDIEVVYEKGKINLNRARAELLSALFVANGVDETEALDLAERVIDWRDADDTTASGGVENDVYASSGLPYGPRNGPFESVGELQHVFGMSRDIYFCVLPSITVYSQNQNVDWDFSDASTLDVLRWAYLRGWQNVGWPDPDALETKQNLMGARSDLGGQSLTLRIILNEDGDQPNKQYSMVIRYKSISNRSGYGVLKPLTPYSENNANCGIFPQG
ncbi:general secretion pathway protein GspK [Kordiimonas sp.]|uniref:general secretion pathway protein GspK n=1 Tax=Kordiimonas sp. TaxID=1970157 RepID=UPI003A94EADE